MADPEGQTDPVVLPSGRFVLVRDYKRAKNGKLFYYYPKMGMGEKRKPVLVPGIPDRECAEYFDLFGKYKLFGLPHGGGWLGELPWVVDFLAFMEKTYNEIEAWQVQKADKESGTVSGLGFD